MRKPATLELVGGKGPRQRIWEAIRGKGAAEWNNYAIARAADADDETAYTYVRGLKLAGYIVETRRERRHGSVAGAWYRLARDIGIEAPRVRKDGSPVTQGLAQEQMWRTLRGVKRDINARELAAGASTPAIPVAETAAGDYLRTLHSAGYLDCTAPGKGNGRGGIQARYRLKAARNTGARAPMVCRARAVFDPNENKIVWQAGVTDEDAIYAR